MIYCINQSQFTDNPIGFTATKKGFQRVGISERLQAVKRHFGWKYNVEMADALNQSKQNVGNWINHDKVPDYEALFAFRSIGINDHWLVTGKGDMLLPPTLDQDPELARLFQELQARDDADLRETFLRVADAILADAQK